MTNSPRIRPSARRAALAGALCLLAVPGLMAWQREAPGAASRAPGGPTVVAVVDLERVTNSLTELKNLNADLKKRAESFQKQIEDSKTKLDNLKKDLELIPEGDAGRRDKIVQILELEAAVEAKGKALQRVIDLEEGDAISSIYATITKAVSQIAQTQNLDLVMVDDRALQLPKTGTGRDVSTVITAKRVLFAAPHLDITDQVILKMNNDYAANKK